VHGVPLGASEYQQMGAVGASLVWSPTSNLLLYGETADVAAAKAAGVNILLAPDWSPSGTKSPLHELKMADWLDENRLGNIFTDYEQVEMVTTNVVDGIGWTDDVGRIQTGLAADLVVIDSFHSDPYRNLIEALDPDVALTIVGGLPIYGDVDLMTQLNGDDKEVITWNGMTKALDVTFMGVDDGEQTWADIEAGLEMALQFNKADMHANFGAAGDMDLAEFTIWADDKWPQLDAIGLDSIFTWGDERYFDRLNGSVGFNQISNIDLWSAYYDIEYDENMNRPGVVIEVPVDVWNLDDYRPVFASNDPIPVTMKVSYGGGKDGVIGFDLYPDKAPFHVDNMLRHIDAGNYDGAKFHRVINDYMIHGGDFESDNGMGGYAARFYGYCNGLEAMPDTCDQTAWTLPDEAGNGLLHTEGALSMHKTNPPNTGGSQFFIVDAGPTPTHLDGVHTVFGRVTSGLDVVNSISEVEVQYPYRPLDDVLIISFARGEPSDHPEPEPGEEAEKKSAPSLAIYAGIAATGLIIIASVAVMLALRKEDDSLE
jgi:cyclophilin family peptidyl-prolyl cis-trans isomerase